MEKWKYNIRKAIGQICLKFCKLIEFFNHISFILKFRCHDNKNANNNLLFEMTKPIVNQQ